MHLMWISLMASRFAYLLTGYFETCNLNITSVVLMEGIPLCEDHSKLYMRTFIDVVNLWAHGMNWDFWKQVAKSPQLRQNGRHNESKWIKMSFLFFCYLQNRYAVLSGNTQIIFKGLILLNVIHSAHCVTASVMYQEHVGF